MALFLKIQYELVNVLLFLAAHDVNNTYYYNNIVVCVVFIYPSSVHSVITHVSTSTALPAVPRILQYHHE